MKQSFAGLSAPFAVELGICVRHRSMGTVAARLAYEVALAVVTGRRWFAGSACRASSS